MLAKPGIQERVYAIRIEGTAPLLMHAPNGLGEKKLAKGVIPSAEEECEAALYRNADGQIVVPARCIEGSFVKAGSSKVAAGQGKKTYKQFILAGTQVAPEEPLLISEKYTIDSRRCVIARAGIIRRRPRFEKWAVEFDLKVFDPYLLQEGMTTQLREILENAGALVGLLDYRPRFGRFIVTKFDVKFEK
jgi:hypothetical protein